MLRPALLLLSAALLAPAALAQSADALDERQAAFFEALASGDAARVASFYAPDAVLHVANRPALAGRPAIEAFYGRVLQFQLSTQATVEHLDVAASGDLAFARGIVVNEFPGEAGPVRYEGKFGLVWRLAGEEWLVLYYSVSSDHSEAR